MNEQNRVLRRRGDSGDSGDSGDRAVCLLCVAVVGFVLIRIVLALYYGDTDILDNGRQWWWNIH